jgi:Leucine-rich repeat (LRR) protein
MGGDIWDSSSGPDFSNSKLDQTKSDNPNGGDSFSDSSQFTSCPKLNIETDEAVVDDEEFRLALGRAYTIARPFERGEYSKSFNPSDSLLRSQLVIEEFTEFKNFHGPYENLCGIGYATNLTRVQLFWSSIKDASAVVRLPLLKDLNLSQNFIENINFVRALTYVEKINIGDNPIEKIDAFNGFENSSLRNLSMHRLPLVSDWSPLRHIRNLTSLNVYENNIKDISFLNSMQQLATLSAEQNQIEDPSPLAGLNQLRFLDLSNNQISTLNFISQLSQLNYVNQWAQDRHLKIDLSNNPLQNIS